MTIDEQWLLRALTLAQEHSANGRNGPFGAVIVREGVVLGEGWNQVVETADPTAHAEVVAVRHACAGLGTHQLDGATLYASCEPCPMCYAAIAWAGIRRIVYSASRQDAAEIGFADARILDDLRVDSGRSVVMTRLFAEDGRNVLLDWQANPKRILY